MTKDNRDSRPGRTEALIPMVREAFGPYAEGLVIATKVGPTEQGLARPDQLRGLVAAGSERLAREVALLRPHPRDSYPALIPGLVAVSAGDGIVFTTNVHRRRRHPRRRSRSRLRRRVHQFWRRGRPSHPAPHRQLQH